MKKIEDIGDLTLNQIKELNNEELINIYNKYLTTLITNRISKRIVETYYGKSINDIAEYIFKVEVEYTSELISNGNLMYYYSNKELSKSHIHHVCCVSGEVILPHTYFYKFKPILENISNNQILCAKKTIYLKEEFEDFIPETLKDFEKLQYLLSEFPTEKTYKNIPYSDIASRIGEVIQFYTINKNVRKRKYCLDNISK